jgi:hypothetical protein
MNTKTKYRGKQEGGGELKRYEEEGKLYVEGKGLEHGKMIKRKRKMIRM